LYEFYLMATAKGAISPPDAAAGLLLLLLLQVAPSIRSSASARLRGVSCDTACSAPIACLFLILAPYVQPCCAAFRSRWLGV
jgi:hypothetical protein